MAQYTLSIAQIARNKENIERLFDFEYPFYLETHRKDFEEKFIYKFINREIGFETLGLFKLNFKAIMTVNAERFETYYKIEKEASKQNYLYNKELTIEEEINGGQNHNGSSNSSSISNSNSNDTSNGTNNTEGSEIGNGLASLKDRSKLTSVSNSKDNVENTNNTKYEDNSQSSSISSTQNNQTLKRREYGNIGVSTGADLQQAWRDVIQTTDEYIFKYLECLFFELY